MAFALTSAYAYVNALTSPVWKRRGEQVIELSFTAAATDVDLDIGDLAGTFWGAVDATDMGAAVLAAITLAYPQWDAQGCIGIQSVQLIDRVQVASLSTTGEYTVAINSTTKLPNLAFTAADGETSWCVKLTMRLDDDQPGVTWAYTA